MAYQHLLHAQDSFYYAKEIENQNQTYFSTIPMTVKRNAYGRQLGSFHTIEEMKGIGKYL